MANDGYLKDPAALPVVTMMGLRLALSRAGKLDAVNTAVAGLGSEAAIAWDYAVSVRSDHPLVLAAASSAGINSDDLAQFFRDAAVASPSNN